MTPGHNGKPDADRIADYLECKADRLKNWAAKTGNTDMRSHATALVVAASDIRARLYED